MSDSPRWHLDGLPGTTGIVEVMLYDDHLAAVEEALQRGAGLAAMAWSSHMQRAVAAAAVPTGVWEEDSFDAGVKAARDAVAAAMAKRGGYHSASEFSAVVLAAIDGVQP